MKVDTNTEGNTFWFYFIVYPARSGQTITFNVLNFTRDQSPFYNKGMNILTKEESEDANENTNWQNDKCFGIEFEKTKDLVRSWLRDKNGDIIGPAKHYYKLSFKYKFENVKEGQGTYFAYAMPYTFSQL